MEVSANTDRPVPVRRPHRVGRRLIHDPAGVWWGNALANPDRLVLQTADQFGNIHLSYTVSAAEAPVPPSITTPPANTRVNVGQTAKFTVTAIGSAPLSYQWRKNGGDIPEATGSSYITPATVAARTAALLGDRPNSAWELTSISNSR